ncbi:MAG: hypothetical protein CME70_05630 [Halobacteriovorax sp.]|nr:hypothetical protein [Halobacteriovorax sp.]|tara:strand:+ start:230 stop:793 length:564 start_codon:yes stop_codon:yes gene_type:complete
MNKIFCIVLVFIAGCSTPKKSVDTLHDYPVIDPSKCPIPLERYDEEFLKASAKSLNMRYVDYLHALTNGKISELRKNEGLFFQAYDPNWANEPSINPIFSTKKEAQDYASRNNMATDRSSNTIGHSYIVREVDYRYEVRIVNPSTNEVLYTTRDFNDAYEYVVEYSSAHADLVIYDLKTGEIFEETP